MVTGASIVSELWPDRACGRGVGLMQCGLGGIEAHHDYVRFSWVGGGTTEAPLYIKGTDFAVIADDGRLKSVIGFTDAAPAPAT